MCFSVEEIKFLRELVWVRGACQYSKERAVKGGNKNRLRRPIVWMYQRESGTAFVAERAEEAAHPGYATMTETGKAAQVSEDSFQSLEYQVRLPEQSFRKFLKLLRSKFNAEDKLRAKENRTLRNYIFNLGAEKRHRSN